MKDISPSDIRHETIKLLFDEQIRRMTMKSCGIKAIDSFDLQFSDHWFRR